MEKISQFGILIIIFCALFIILGFGNKGVRRGSIASSIQSLIRNIIKGSIFAIFQSLGMKWTFYIGIVIGIGMVYKGEYYK